jgi:TetR/AcrR family transcriptional regulator, transcriptional repressor for nem operon
VLEVITLQTERVLNAQQPHLGAMESLKTIRMWRDVIIKLNALAHTQGCPLGSLASELANDSEAARKRLAASFAMWSDSIERGLTKMHQSGALSPSANPPELAVALLSAVQGGLLLSKTTQTSRPLEIALDMAIDHIARHMKRKAGRDR